MKKFTLLLLVLLSFVLTNCETPSVSEDIASELDQQAADEESDKDEIENESAD